jgi:hypothetical protein
MGRFLAAAVLAGLWCQDGGDAAAEKAKLHEELAKAVEKVADQLLKWKSWDEARAFLDVVRAKSDARAAELDKLLAKTEKQTSGWEWDRRTMELIKEFGKERARRFYAFARAWKEKDPEASRWTDAEGEILDDVLDYVKAYGRLCQVRAQHALPKTRFDWKLSVPAVWHAKYILLNPTDSTEIDGKPGYTPAGKIAGARSITNSSKSLPELMQGIVHSPFQRNYILNPALTATGLGQGKGSDSASAVDVESSLEPANTIAGMVTSPHDNSTGIPIAGYDDDIKLIPGKSLRDLGHPISAIFYDPQVRIGDVKARVLENKNDVEIYLSTPEHPALPERYPNNKNTILIVPKGKLKQKTTYQVSITYTIKGESRQITWTFTTGP